METPFIGYAYTQLTNVSVPKDTRVQNNSK